MADKHFLWNLFYWLPVILEIQKQCFDISLSTAPLFIGVGQILKMLGYAIYTTDGIFHAHNSIINLFLVWYIWYFIFIEHKLYFYEFLFSLINLWQINSCRKIHRSYLLIINAFLAHINIIFVLVAWELPVKSQFLLLKTFAHESIDKTIIKFSKKSLDPTSGQ